MRDTDFARIVRPLVVLNTFLLGMVLAGCLVDPNKPPTPTTVEAIAKAAMLDYVNGMAQIATDCAEKIRAGELAAKEDCIKFVKDARLELQDRAFEPLHAAMDKDHGEATHRAIARGFAGVLKETTK